MCTQVNTHKHTLANTNTCTYLAPKSMHMHARHTHAHTQTCTRKHASVHMHMDANTTQAHRTSAQAPCTFFSLAMITAHSFMQQTYVEPFSGPGLWVGPAHPAKRTRGPSLTFWELTVHAERRQ